MPLGIAILRKIVPLQEDDPMVFQRPLVGVWIRGLDDPREHAVYSPEDVQEQQQHHQSLDAQCAILYKEALQYHPLVWSAFLRFLFSRSVKERAMMTDDVGGNGVTDQGPFLFMWVPSQRSQAYQFDGAAG